MNKKTIIESLLEDHGQIRHMLRLFERESAVFSKGGVPDYDLLAGALDYLRDYLDAVHHPLEDRIAEYLARRETLSAKAFARLHQVHQDLEALTIQVAREFSSVRDDAVGVRERLCAFGNGMIETYRDHLAWEEARFFPLAQRSLTPADWAAILEGGDALLDLDYAKKIRDRFGTWLKGYEAEEHRAEMPVA